MARKVRLRKVGGSVSATLPKELADRYHLQPGDTVHVRETAEGLLITPYDPTFQKALAVYERGSRRYRNALRELAGLEPEG